MAAYKRYSERGGKGSQARASNMTARLVLVAGSWATSQGMAAGVGGRVGRGAALCRVAASSPCPTIPPQVTGLDWLLIQEPNFYE